MAILDSLINEVAERYGLGGKARPLLSGLLSLITNEQTGGLAGFLDQFRRAGLGDVVSPWVNRSGDYPITPSQLETALGANVIDRLASNAGIPSSSASAALAFLVPRVVDQLTPDGVVPARLPRWASSYLNGVDADAGQIAGAAERTGGSVWRMFLSLVVRDRQTRERPSTSGGGRLQ